MTSEWRDQLNQLGSELSGILEDASAEAALLPAIPDERCSQAIDKLRGDIEHAEAVVHAMRALTGRLS